MPDVDLSQAEADALIVMEKEAVDNQKYDFPSTGGSLIIPLHSPDKKENFLLDISRSKIDLLKGKYQNRARHVFVLMRLDFGGAPHRNPDGVEILCPHLHVYREGYGDKWAFEVPNGHFSDLTDYWKALQDFMRYCNITTPPNIERGLFS